MLNKASSEETTETLSAANMETIDESTNNSEYFQNEEVNDSDAEGMSDDEIEQVEAPKSKKQFSCLSDNFEIVKKNKQSLKIIEDVKDCKEFPVVESWKSFGLDRRIISSVFRQGFHEPTRVQQIAIPIALSGKDIVCSSSTGTGKTAAFMIPALQMILHERKLTQTEQETDRVKQMAETLLNGENGTDKQNLSIEKRGVKILYLVPSQELCIQVHQQWKLLAQFCREECNCIYFRSELSHLQQDIKDLSDLQHPILISTPESLSYALSNSSISLKETLKVLIIDEADQIIRKQMELITMLVSRHLPGLFQCILTSATMKAHQAISLKEQLLKDPVVIQLDKRTQSLEGKLYQYYVDMKQLQDKLPNAKVNSVLLLYYFLNHKFYGGRVIVYVPANKLFFVYYSLRAFGVNCAMLPYFYPTLSKIDIIKKFNNNEYQILISTMAPEHEAVEEGAEDELYIPNKFTAMINQLERRAKGIDKTKHSTTVSHLSRGIDYKRVAACIYFDLPRSCIEYIHGVGRTARAGNIGVSVTFIQPYADRTAWEKLKTEIETKYGIEGGLQPYPEIDLDLVFENEYRASLLIGQLGSLNDKYREAVDMEISNQIRLTLGKEVGHDMQVPINVEFGESHSGMVRQDPLLLKAGLLANVTSKGEIIRSKSDVYSKGKSLKTKTSDSKILINKKIQQENKQQDPLFHFQKAFVDKTIERLENAAPVENFMNKLTNNALGTDNIIKHQRQALLNPKTTSAIKKAIASSHKQKVESLKRGLASANMLNPHRKKFKEGFRQQESQEGENNFENSYGESSSYGQNSYGKSYGESNSYGGNSYEGGYNKQGFNSYNSYNQESTNDGGEASSSGYGDNSYGSNSYGGNSYGKSYGESKGNSYGGTTFGRGFGNNKGYSISNFKKGSNNENNEGNNEASENYGEESYNNSNSYNSYGGYNQDNSYGNKGYGNNYQTEQSEENTENYQDNSNSYNNYGGYNSYNKGNSYGNKSYGNNNYGGYNSYNNRSYGNY